MPFPPGLSTCHVSGTFYDSMGSLDEGTITLTQTPPALRVDSPSYAIDQRPITLALVAGVIAADITATDNAGVGPTGWTYRVDYALRSRSQTLYTFAPAGQTVDLAQIAGTEPIDHTATRVLTVGGAGPDVNGNVPIDSIPGSPGPAGRGVTGTAIVGGHLIVSYSDATQQDVGQVVGANGTNGTNGADGDDGAPGRGVTNTAIVGGHLVITYSDATQQDVGQVVGANGTNGTNGANGAVGPQGPPGPAPAVRHTRIISGNISVPNTGGGWDLLAGVALSLPAAVGDYVELGVAAMRSPTGTMFLDACVAASGEPAVFLTTGTGTPAVEGDPTWYPPEGGTIPYPAKDTPRGFVVESGHLTAGAVVFGIAAKGEGSGTLYASAAFPLYLNAKNFGPCDVA